MQSYRPFNEIKEIMSTLSDPYKKIEPINQDKSESEAFYSMAYKSPVKSIYSDSFWKESQFSKTCIADFLRSKLPDQNQTTINEFSEEAVQIECPEELMTDSEMIKHFKHDLKLSVLGVACRTCRIILVK